MKRKLRTSSRSGSLVFRLGKRSYRKLSTIWIPENPLPLLRWSVSLYKSMTDRQFSDADPFGVIDIDPLEVTHVSNRAKDWDSWLGEVVGGDWDRRSVLIDEVPLVSVLTAHIQDGEPLDCEAYREYYLQERRRIDPFELRCHHVKYLIWDIDYHGYRSQRELVECERVYTLQKQNNDTIHPLLNEIRVDIDRHGRFHHWRCGLHRLAITRALGIETIPVLVGTRHEEWQAVRNQFRQASAVEELPEALREYVGHPDLRGLLTNAGADAGSASTSDQTNSRQLPDRITHCPRVSCPRYAGDSRESPRPCPQHRRVNTDAETAVEVSETVQTKGTNHPAQSCTSISDFVCEE